MIRLHLLEADGFRQLREVKLAIPDRCCVLVEGENEAGKSTLFEAVYYALYGKAITKALTSDLIGNRQKAGYVHLAFSVDGAQVDIVRQLRRTRQRPIPQAQIKVTRVDGTVEPLDGPERVNKEILAVIHGLDAETLRHSCFVEQKGLDRLTELTPNDRKNILLKLLDQGELLAANKHFERLKLSEGVIVRAERVTQLARTFRQLRETHTECDRASRELRLTQLAETLAEWEARLEEAETQWRESQDLAREAEQLKTRIATVEGWVQAASEMRLLADARQALVNNQRRLKELDEQLAELAQLADEVLPKLRERRGLLERAKGKVDEIAQYEAQQQAAEQRLSRLEAIIHWQVDGGPLRAKVSDLKERQRSLQSAVGQAHDQLIEAEAQNQELTRQRERLERLETIMRKAQDIEPLRANVEELQQQQVNEQQNVDKQRRQWNQAQTAHTAYEQALQRTLRLTDLLTRVGEIQVQREALDTHAQAAEAERTLAHAKSIELEQAQAAHTSARRAAALRQWAQAQHQVIEEREALQITLNEIDGSLAERLTQQATADSVARTALRQRIWALTPGMPAFGLLIAAVVILLGWFPVLIDARVLALGLTLAGLTLAGLTALLWIRTSRRVKAFRNQATQLEREARELSERRAGQAGQLIAYAYQAKGLLVVPRERLAELNLVEPESVEIAETLVAEIQAEAGDSLPDLDALSRALRKVEDSASQIESKLQQDRAILAEREAQLLKALQDEGVAEFAVFADSLARAQRETQTLLETGLPDLAILETTLKESETQLGEIRRTLDQQEGALAERELDLARQLREAGVGSLDSAGDYAARLLGEVARQVQELPDLSILQRTWEDTQAAERTLADELGQKEGELRARDEHLARLLADEKLGAFNEMEAARAAAHQQMEDRVIKREEAVEVLQAMLRQLNLDPDLDVVARRLLAEIGRVDSEIQNGETQLESRAAQQARHGELKSEMSRQQGRMVALEAAITAKRQIDPTISLPDIGEEEAVAATLEECVLKAGLSEMKTQVYELRNRETEAKVRASQAQQATEQAQKRIGELLPELGQTTIIGSAPQSVRAAMPDLPKADPVRRQALEKQLHALEIDVAQYTNICADLQRELGIDPATLNETDENARLEELHRQQRVSRLAVQIINLTRTNLLNQLMPSTLEFACQFLPYLTNGRYHDATLDETNFQLKVWDAQFGRMVERDLFSGGAQDQFALALRLGFAVAALPQELGAAPAFIFLDEPVASFDRIRREAFVDLVRHGLIGDRFHQIFISEPEGIFSDNPFPHYIRMQGGRIIEQRLG